MTTPPLSPVTDAFLARLGAALPDGTLRAPAPRYGEDPRGTFTGAMGAVAAPRTTAEVQVILRACHADRVGVVPYAGGTGLVAGQILPDGPAPLVLSLERMSAIRETRARDGMMIAEGGAILADVQAAADAAGRLFPLSLASEGSARIGGLLATNAGGVNVLRYGNARALCLGVEAVLADGTLINNLTPLWKDNTGYDIRDLLIGSEGTLGILTAAVLKLVPRPRSTAAALLVIETPEAALDLLELVRDRVGEGVTAFELISGVGLDFLAETMPDLRQPFADRPAWSVLVELGLFGTETAQAALERIFEAAAEVGLAQDGLIASSEAQRQAFWTLREALPEGNKRVGAVASHDISLPTGALPGFIRRGAELVAGLGPFRVNCFGHVGDGNLHYNVFPPQGESPAAHRPRRFEIMRAVHDLVAEFGGSFSAEHGVGRLKMADLERYGDPGRLAAMRAVKAALDPKGILNPGAVLRA